MSTTSLNGGQTHPLSAAAYLILLRLREGPQLIAPRVRRLRINPGVVDRLTREPEPLAVRVSLAGRKGLEITDAGRRYSNGGA